MAGPAIPTNRDVSSSIADHTADHNQTAAVVDRFDQATASHGDVLQWNSGLGLYTPTPLAGLGTVGEFDIGSYSGVDPSGATHSNAAFAAAYSAAVSAAVANSGVSGEANNRGRIKIKVPPGRYKLTADNAMMAALSGTRTYGIHYAGAGRGLTEVLWQPATSGKQLFRNNDVWLGVKISGINFVSATAGSRWFYSTSAGGAQDYLIEDCGWYGLWEYGLGLDGTNCNSEIVFRRPWVEGAYTDSFWHIGMTAATSAQDQFVNYDVDAPSIFLDGTTFLRADYGGAIRMRGGNYVLSGTNPLLYDLRNNTHNRAAESFLQEGGRIELRSATAKTISCAWGRGQVTFDTIDEESQVDVVSQTVTTHSYKPGNNDGPGVVYRNSKLSGRHEYGYGPNTYARERRVLYDNSETHDEPHNFIVNTDEGSGNVGGLVKAEFRRHRTRLYDEFRVYDQVTNWQTATLAEPQRRSATFRSPYGGLPANTPSIPSVDVWLPMGAVVTAVRFYKPAGGAATNTNWSYDVKTSEGTPTTLGSASGGGSVQWTTGFNEVDTVNNFVCNSDAKRHLVLSATNVTGDAGSTSFVLVEYIA